MFARRNLCLFPTLAHPLLFRAPGPPPLPLPTFATSPPLHSLSLSLRHRPGATATDSTRGAAEPACTTTHHLLLPFFPPKCPPPTVTPPERITPISFDSSLHAIRDWHNPALLSDGCLQPQCDIIAPEEGKESCALALRWVATNAAVAVAADLPAAPTPPHCKGLQRRENTKHAISGWNTRRHWGVRVARRVHDKCGSSLPASPLASRARILSPRHGPQQVQKEEVADGARPGSSPSSCAEQRPPLRGDKLVVGRDIGSRGGGRLWPPCSLATRFLRGYDGALATLAIRLPGAVGLPAHAGTSGYAAAAGPAASGGGGGATGSGGTACTRRLEALRRAG